MITNNKKKNNKLLSPPNKPPIVVPKPINSLPFLKYYLASISLALIHTMKLWALVLIFFQNNGIKHFVLAYKIKS